MRSQAENDRIANELMSGFQGNEDPNMIASHSAIAEVIRSGASKEEIMVMPELEWYADTADWLDAELSE